MLPAPLRSWLEAEVGPLDAVEAVSGGCINETLRVRTSRGDFFVKYRHDAPAGFFAAEAAALARLSAAESPLRIPAVLAMNDGADGDGGPSALLLEWLEPTGRGADFDARLGHGLAKLHRTRASGWGGVDDGFIGPLVQPNRNASSWADFWCTQRLEPQLRRARELGRAAGGKREWDRLLSAMPVLLAAAEDDGASLLHGDLWSGNVLATSAGPALIDPASYFGHREVDLAMSELFGGFGSAFLAGYEETWPLQPGYAEARRAVYQLYYLLVHVNLFGESYLPRTLGTLRRALQAI
jgi:fructosamine-3-kinase